MLSTPHGKWGQFALCSFSVLEENLSVVDDFLPQGFLRCCFLSTGVNDVDEHWLSTPVSSAGTFTS